MAQSIEDLARLTYTAYGSAVGYKNFQGDPMPDWEDLGEAIQRAWVLAAHTAYLYGRADGAARGDRLVAE